MSGNQGQAGITILITDKSCLQEKHSEQFAHKGNCSSKDRTIVNIYAPNTVAPDFIFKKRQ